MYTASFYHVLHNYGLSEVKEYVAVLASAAQLLFVSCLVRAPVEVLSARELPVAV